MSDYISSVRITYFALKNLDPIYRSTGRKWFEIDFSKSSNRVCLILAANGMGKTWLMSNISPAPIDAIQDRKNNAFIENEDGEKYCHYLVNERYLYRCTILYSHKGNKTTCYIEREDTETGMVEELNPNGNVTSYWEAIENHLGYSKAFTTIGYLSDRMTNVVQMRPVERNNYISTWLPSIAEFLSGYQTVKKKYNGNKKQIQVLDKEMGNLIVSDYNRESDRLNRVITNYTEKIDFCTQRITEGNTRLDFIGDIPENELSREIERLKVEGYDLQRKREYHNNLLNSLIQYTGREGNKKLNEDIREVESSIQNKERDVSERESKINSLERNIEELQGSVSDEASGELTEIIRNLDYIKNELGSTKQIIGAIKQNQPQWMIQLMSTYKDEARTVDRILSIVRDITRLQKEIQENLYTGMFNKPIQETENDIVSKINLNRKETNRLQDSIQEKNNRIYSLRNHGLPDDILEKRSKTCNASSCGLYRELLKFFSPDSEIEEIQNDIQKLTMSKIRTESELADIQEEMKQVELAKNYLRNLKSILDEYQDIKPELPKDMMYLFSTDLEPLIIKTKEFVSMRETIKEYYSLVVKYINLEEKINSLEDKRKISFFQSKMKKEMEDSLHQRETLNEERIRIYEEIKELRTRLEELNIISEKKDKLSDDIDMLNRNILIHQENTNNIQKKCGSLYQRKHIQDIIHKTRMQKEELLLARTQYEDELRSLETKKISWDSLEKTRNNILEKQKIYEVLMQIWSPRSGYPSLLIKDFLEDIRQKSNKALREVWGDGLEIEDFIVSNSEFSIPIKKDNELTISDASQCSESERGIISLAISISIIDSAMELPYNILRLDEVDGALDHEKRKTFIDMLLDKLENMNCNKAFVISHNNEFDNIDADVILLPGYNKFINMENKNVLLDLSTN